jgi:hypothetical protein
MDLLSHFESPCAESTETANGHAARVTASQ